ncbi:MAG: hypothetical protein J6386_20470 [Candidatus Synoicihabitans palmerolidicus]|nr:hypothetical protein [Candidatus Synoicihabitans palmerolidicus]
MDYPRDGQGRLRNEVLSATEWARFKGILGHYHVQANKIDPGAALQWERVLSGARALLAREAVEVRPVPSKAGGDAEAKEESGSKDAEDAVDGATNLRAGESGGSRDS